MNLRKPASDMPGAQPQAHWYECDEASSEPVVLPDRLSEIETRWTLMKIAHGEDAGARLARDNLLRDYYGVVYKYLCGITHDAATAEDLSQSFALRFIEGGFRHADPERGRFRDYLKTSLKHMVYDHTNERKASRGLIQEPITEPPASDFDAHWSAEMLKRSWTALERAWKRLDDEKPVYHALLELLRVDPSLRSPQLVVLLATQRGIDRKEDWVRQAKKRAWEQFARLLIDEVASTLESGDLGLLAAELIELDLIRYCRSNLIEKAALAIGTEDHALIAEKLKALGVFEQCQSALEERRSTKRS
jgi:RNA polymerase sigma-70 factor (ECF subfamily)